MKENYIIMSNLYNIQISHKIIKRYYNKNVRITSKMIK